METRRPNIRNETETATGKSNRNFKKMMLVPLAIAPFVLGQRANAGGIEKLSLNASGVKADSLRFGESDASISQKFGTVNAGRILGKHTISMGLGAFGSSVGQKSDAAEPSYWAATFGGRATLNDSWSVAGPVTVTLGAGPTVRNVQNRRELVENRVVGHTTSAGVNVGSYFTSTLTTNGKWGNAANATLSVLGVQASVSRSKANLTTAELSGENNTTQWSATVPLGAVRIGWVGRTSHASVTDTLTLTPNTVDTSVGGVNMSVKAGSVSVSASGLTGTQNGRQGYGVEGGITLAEYVRLEVRRFQKEDAARVELNIPFGSTSAKPETAKGNGTAKKPGLFKRLFGWMFSSTELEGGKPKGAVSPAAPTAEGSGELKLPFGENQ